MDECERVEEVQVAVGVFGPPEDVGVRDPAERFGGGADDTGALFVGQALCCFQVGGQNVDATGSECVLGGLVVDVLEPPWSTTAPSAVAAA